MSNLVKKLAGETAIYGLSSIVGRVLGYLLMPLYTDIFLKEEYGIVSQLYAWVAFLMVLFICRIDTAFFRFGTDKEGREEAYSTAFWTVAFNTVFLAALILVFAGQIAGWFALPPGGAGFIRMFGLVLAFDTLSEIPLARLRLESRPMRFATIRLVGIAVNMGLNLFFLLLCPWLITHGYAGWLTESVYDPKLGIYYIFFSNLMSSAVVLLLLLPEIRKVQWRFDTELWKTMVIYAAPLILASLAGIVNEMIDREMLVRLLPFDTETNRGEQGVYSACYKLAMLMSLFTQAFRYAAEPFFFANAKNKDSRQLYADVAKYFTIIGALAFLSITFYLDLIKVLFLRNPDYWAGLGVVPILLMANLFLGLYYNVAVWYKLTDQTNKGGIIAVGGALITIGLNYWWIPWIGYMGSAWATLICYFSMTLACLLWGRKYFPIPYNLGRIGFYIVLSLLLYFASRLFGENMLLGQHAIYIFNTMLLAIFIFVSWRLEKNTA